MFLLGGFKKGVQSCCADFYEITFPKDPLNEQIIDHLVVKKLPDLPYMCCLPMGLYDDGKVYLFGGLEFKSTDNVRMNSDVHVFVNG